MDLRELLHDIVDELQHLPASVKGDWHKRVDEAVGAVKDEAVAVAEADPVKPPETPVVTPPAK